MREHRRRLLRMRAFVVAAALIAGLASAGASSLDTEPFRRVLRAAAPAVSRCAHAHTLPVGHYVMSVRVGEATGRAKRVAVTDDPGDVTREGIACLERVFGRLRFPIVDPRRDGNGDEAEIVISWPFELR